jgi:hypothetical protein
MCTSSNPPSVSSGISLSSQPEQVQDLHAPFGLAPLGSAFSFQYQDTQVTVTIIIIISVLAESFSVP